MPRERTRTEPGRFPASAHEEDRLAANQLEVFHAAQISLPAHLALGFNPKYRADFFNPGAGAVRTNQKVRRVCTCGGASR